MWIHFFVIILVKTIVLLNLCWNYIRTLSMKKIVSKPFNSNHLARSHPFSLLDGINFRPRVFVAPSSQHRYHLRRFSVFGLSIKFFLWLTGAEYFVFSPDRKSERSDSGSSFIELKWKKAHLFRAKFDLSFSLFSSPPSFSRRRH